MGDDFDQRPAPDQDDPAACWNPIEGQYNKAGTTGGPAVCSPDETEEQWSTALPDGPTGQTETPEMQQQAADLKAKSDCDQWFMNNPEAGMIPQGQWCQPDASPIRGPNPKAWNVPSAPNTSDAPGIPGQFPVVD